MEASSRKEVVVGTEPGSHDSAADPRTATVAQASCPVRRRGRIPRNQAHVRRLTPPLVPPGGCAGTKPPGVVVGPGTFFLTPRTRRRGPIHAIGLVVPGNRGIRRAFQARLGFCGRRGGLRHEIF